MRIGLGYDIHELQKGRKLYLGGVEVPHCCGLLGHSDADVLLHAICDGILGAAGLGDIGDYFPDSDAQFKDISSLKLLVRSYKLVKEQGYRIGNIDCIIFAQEIKISPFKIKIKESISKALQISAKLVNIKAKTMEGLDAVGQNKAIAASCAVLLLMCND